jgi:hypothetical protein
MRSRFFQQHRIANRGHVSPLVIMWAREMDRFEYMKRSLFLIAEKP